MTDKVRRNDPCPCGSGKKYKSCCGRESQPARVEPKVHAQFRFEPGSYGEAGSFLPSIACLAQTSADQWHHHFVLVKLPEQYEEEDEAAAVAETDLHNAFLRKEQTGSEVAVAAYLRARGYVSVTGFSIAQDGNSTGWRG